MTSIGNHGHFSHHVRENRSRNIHYAIGTATSLPPHLLPLLRPEAYPHPVAGIRLIETHISWVLLTGEFAYKLKRPVRYPFIDLRSPQRRAFYCDEEVRLNARFAPQLYLGVSRVTSGPRGLRMAGAGAVVEHAVRMRQFHVDETLDRLVDAGRITMDELAVFGHDLAAIHLGLPRTAESDTWGSFDGVRTQLRTNVAECRRLAASLGTGPGIEALGVAIEARLHALETHIPQRRQQGRVRECHGDLHARNVVRHQGRLLAFDCLEFEPAFRWIDVAEEVAFLWMDLDARQRADLAHAFLSGYLLHDGDYGLCRMLGVYGAHRALVRAKVAALECRDATNESTRAQTLAQHLALLDCVQRLLAPRRGLLVLMCGLSGSGKTWLARQLAPALCAIHLRSDAERKRLAGLGAAADSHSAVGRDLYAPGTSRRVYEHLAQCADAVLGGQMPVIVDATFARRDERAHFRELANALAVDLVVVWCTAPRAVLEARIGARRSGASDASEADLDVLAWQTAHAEAIAPDETLRVIHVDTTAEGVAADVVAALGKTRAARSGER